MWCGGKHKTQSARHKVVQLVKEFSFHCCKQSSLFPMLSNSPSLLPFYISQLPVLHLLSSNIHHSYLLFSSPLFPPLLYLLIMLCLECFIRLPSYLPPPYTFCPISISLITRSLSLSITIHTSISFLYISTFLFLPLSLLSSIVYFLLQFSFLTTSLPRVMFKIIAYTHT